MQRLKQPSKLKSRQTRKLELRNSQGRKLFGMDSPFLTLPRMPRQLLQGLRRLRAAVLRVKTSRKRGCRSEWPLEVSRTRLRCRVMQVCPGLYICSSCCRILIAPSGLLQLCVRLQNSWLVKHSLSTSRQSPSLSISPGISSSAFFFPV